MNGQEIKKEKRRIYIRKYMRQWRLKNPGKSKKSEMKRKVLREKRKSLKICIDCEKPTITSVYCPECLILQAKSRNKRRKYRRKNGICTHCRKKAVNSSSLCERHILEKISYRYFRTTKYADKLREKLTSQNYKCVYSGFPLRLGVNTEVDHILPKYLGGKNTINNLQWVDSSVNKMKNFLSEDEFLRIVKAICINLKSIL